MIHNNSLVKLRFFFFYIYIFQFHFSYFGCGQMQIINLNTLSSYVSFLFPHLSFVMHSFYFPVLTFQVIL